MVEIELAVGPVTGRGHRDVAMWLLHAPTDCAQPIWDMVALAALSEVDHPFTL